MAVPTTGLETLTRLKGIVEGPLYNKLLSFIQSVEKEIQPHVDSYIASGLLIRETDPLKFIATLLVALQKNIPTFLGNPNWGLTEWEQVFDTVNPKVFGPLPTQNIQPSAKENIHSLDLFQNYLMIPTGGTTGQLRFTVHDWKNLLTSTKTTQDFLNLSTLNAYNTLPLYHVSGLMPIIRALTTGGDVVFCDYKEWLKGNFPIHLLLNPILSLVPTQLEELLKFPSAIQFLKNFHTIFVGSGPCLHSILNKAKEHQLPISLVYGMTETCSMVCAIPSSEFLLGNYSIATPLSRNTFTVDEEQLIHIQSPSNFYGYYPNPPIKYQIWKTHDRGLIHQNGRIAIIGRTDRILITGGEKVDPQEVEASILKTGLAHKAVVTSIPDLKWGQKIVCAYISTRLHSTKDLAIQLKPLLTSYKLPKILLQVAEIPTTSTGKIDYLKIQQLFNHSS